MKPAKPLRVLFIFIFLFTFFFFFFSSVSATCPPTDYDCQIAELQRELDARREAHDKNKISLQEYEQELVRINQRLAALEVKLGALEDEIKGQELNLAFQEELLAQRVRSYYIERQRFSLLLLLFSSESAQELTRELGFRLQVASQDRRLIGELSRELLDLKNDKASLEKSKSSLAGLKNQVGSQAEFMRGEVEKTEAFFAQILAKQGELRALKAGGFQTSVGEVPPADDPASRPDYNPGFSPAFAAFSFGYPHRKGMSQYGAFGRAKSGQSYQDILRAYYGDVEVRKVGMPGSINTSVGAMAFEGRYLLGIAEMPTKWADEGGFEALKAQAVAARSYGLSYVGWRMSSQSVKGSICVTESCQVYTHSKANNPGRWGDAVRATEGEILVSRSSGEVVNSWYASTAGGYLYSYSSLGHRTPGFWDTPRGRDGWTNEAWEKVAGSPWFYKAWYRKRSGSSCGRSHPWLNGEEFADLLNALLIYKADEGAVSHLSSLDAQSCFGKEISDTWDMGRVAQEAGKYGGPVTRVDSISVTYSNDGYTQQVSFSTDKGTKPFSGDDFKYIFNLRAPGAIGLKSRLFNLMKK